MRTFISLVIYGLLTEAHYKNYIDLNAIWQLFLSFGFLLALIRDVVEIQTFIVTTQQLKKTIEKIRDL